jgi:hypothetical protein
MANSPKNSATSPDYPLIKKICWIKNEEYNWIEEPDEEVEEEDIEAILREAREVDEEIRKRKHMTEEELQKDLDELIEACEKEDNPTGIDWDEEYRMSEEPEEDDIAYLKEIAKDRERYLRRNKAPKKEEKEKEQVSEGSKCDDEKE